MGCQLVETWKKKFSSRLLFFPHVLTYCEAPVSLDRCGLEDNREYCWAALIQGGVS